MADQQGRMPSRWLEFLAEKYDGGKRKVPNPNPKTRKTYPDVALTTAMIYEVGGRKPVWERTLKEYDAWLKKPAKPRPSEKSDKKPEDKPFESGKAVVIARAKTTDPMDDIALEALQKEVDNDKVGLGRLGGLIYRTKALKKRLEEAQRPDAPHPKIERVGNIKAEAKPVQYTKEELKFWGAEKLKSGTPAHIIARKKLDEMPVWIKGLIGAMPIYVVAQSQWREILDDLQVPPNKKIKGLYATKSHRMFLAQDNNLNDRQYGHVVSHELGHAFGFNLLEPPKDEARVDYITEIWRGMFPKELDQKYVSSYAASDPHEDVAECFGSMDSQPETFEYKCPEKAAMLKKLTASPESLVRTLWDFELTRGY